MGVFTSPNLTQPLSPKRNKKLLYSAGGGGFEVAGGGK